MNRFPISPRPTTSEPENRRPIAALFRRTAEGAVELCRRRGIHPNSVSSLSVVASAGAAAALAAAGHPVLGPWWGKLLILAAVALGAFRLWLNMLDGMVALGTGKTSPWGEVMNELPDRISDVLIFTGLAASGLCRPGLALWAAIASLLIAYVGTLGQAVGAGRLFGGWMSKPWRMVAVGAGLLLALPAGDLPPLLAAFGFTGGPSFLDLALLSILGGAGQTLWVRLRALHGNLTAPKPAPIAFHRRYPRAAA